MVRPLLLVAALFISTLQAADWTRFRSGDIELLTDASEKAARQTLDRFGQIRSLLPEKAPAAIPLRVFLFASQREYRGFAPTATATGFYQSGFDRDTIAMFAATNLPRVAVHEFVHFALNTRGSIRTAWLEEGLAEFYSNVEFTRGGVRLGAPIAEHMATLAKSTWLTPEELEKPHEEPVFYAQSWLLVHMLRGREPIPQRITAELLAEARVYLKKLRPEVRKVSLSTPASVGMEPLAPVEALLVRAELALRTRRLELGRRFYEQAAREYPNQAAAVAGLGALAAAEGDRGKGCGGVPEGAGDERPGMPRRGSPSGCWRTTRLRCAGHWN